MKLSDLLSSTDIVSLTYGTFHLTLTVNSGMVTPELLTNLTMLAKPATGADASAAQVLEIPATVCKLVASWDLPDDEGGTYPLTVEEVAKLPIRFVVAVLKSATALVGEESAAPAPSAATSDATSLPAAQ